MVMFSKFHKLIAHTTDGKILIDSDKEKIDIISTWNWNIHKQMMISSHAENHILKCWQLFDQNLYIWLYQSKLRSEEIIYLCDVVVSGGNVNSNELEKKLSYYRSDLQGVHGRCNDIYYRILSPRFIYYIHIQSYVG